MPEIPVHLIGLLSKLALESDPEVVDVIASLTTDLRDMRLEMANVEQKAHRDVMDALDDAMTYKERELDERDRADGLCEQRDALWAARETLIREVKACMVVSGDGVYYSPDGLAIAIAMFVAGTAGVM